MPVLEDGALSDRPLVTLVLVSYNQEKYIREAVDAAFAQTYSPLTIEISDDASVDKTYEIIQQMCLQPEFLASRHRSETSIGPETGWRLSMMAVLPSA